MSLDILESILCIFLIALFVTVILRQLRLSVILGYLFVGALVGPHALNLIPDSHSIKELAEFGIVFLMFTVGLEFSLPKLFSLRYPVFFIGGLQVLLTTVITMLLGMAFGMPTVAALIVGGITAMSSTAIVVKQLNDQLELHSPHGLNAIGVLLFQDLAVIPFIILISSLANTKVSLGMVFLIALLKGIFAILIIFIVGRKLLKPLFRLIAKTRAIELFTLTVLLVTLSSAWLTYTLGLSFALGAFLAGIMLGETEFRHQIEVEIRPFRDILLGLFFITIGLLTDVSTWHHTYIWIALLVVAIVFGKILIITLLSRLCGYNSPVSLRTGLVLAQGGEFGFALLTLALNESLIPQTYSQVVLAALLISIAVSPVLIFFNEKITTFLLKKESTQCDQGIQQQISLFAKNLHNHIVLCGYGRVGQHIARLLDKIEVPYIGLDMDAELVQRASLAGDHVIYGDVTHPAILNAAGLDHAKVLVISLSDRKSAAKILASVKQTHPDLPTLVRCRDEQDLKKLKALGATHVIAEIYEESLTLSHYLMQMIEMPANKIEGLIEEARNSDYDLLKRVFIGAYDNEQEEDIAPVQELRPILITENAYAVSHQLSEFDFKAINIEVIAIRRGEEKDIKPRPDLTLEANDILILFGDTTNLEAAEYLLLQGQ